MYSQTHRNAEDYWIPLQHKRVRMRTTERTITETKPLKRAARRDTHHPSGTTICYTYSHNIRAHAHSRMQKTWQHV